MLKGHRTETCQCPICIRARGKKVVHKEDCTCASCRSNKGGFKGEEHGNWKGGKETRICIVCSNKFECLPTSKQKCCNRLCADIHHSKKIRSWKDNPFRKGFKGKKNGRWKEKEIRICVACGDSFECISTSKRKCCSNRLCADIWHSEVLKNWQDNPFRKGFKGKENGRWNGGSSFEPYGMDFNNELKFFIRQRDNFTCQFCGAFENGRAFPVHHIDYSKKNNNPLNLILLCESHNSKANSNRKKWQFLFETLQEIRRI